MNSSLPNPFNLTKANDFSASQIQEYWVDMPEGNGLMGLLKPTSPMPMLVLGGKGSGKTHLMRFCSFELQRVRSGSRPLISTIESEGFMGIYVRCEGLNASRFADKGQPTEVWNDVFQYHMELFLAELLVRQLSELFTGDPSLSSVEPDLVREIVSLFDEIDGDAPTKLAELIALLKRLKAEVDAEVNNCALRRTLNVRIRTSRSRLIFGIPALAADHIRGLKHVTFQYLIDELENFSVDQQRYVFTLVRERRGPSSLKVGARLYGVKTRYTFSGDEEIKEGAEFEQLPLDEMLRADSKAYNAFARRLVSSRISHLGLGQPQAAERVGARLDEMFETHPVDKFFGAQTAHVLSKYRGTERPYFQRLVKELVSHAKFDEQQAMEVIGLVRCPEKPILEKANVLMLYKAWASNADIAAAAREVKLQCEGFVAGDRLSGEYEEVFSHFSTDLLAQLLRQTDRDLDYLGIDNFIHMSMGLPRNLLICLKHVFYWAVFGGERVFQGDQISVEAQRRGVKQSADWFFRDASTKGEEGRFLQEAITRLAEMFREIRFSGKPSECSICAFSTDTTRLSVDAAKYLVLAEMYSLLIKIPDGQKDRNSMRVDAKYQLNSMLAPRWDLPIFRRGALPISGELMNAIFDPARTSDFPGLLKERVAGMNPPFGGRRRQMKGNASESDTPDNLQLGFENV